MSVMSCICHVNHVMSGIFGHLGALRPWHRSPVAPASSPAVVAAQAKRWDRFELDHAHPCTRNPLLFRRHVSPQYPAVKLSCLICLSYLRYLRSQSDSLLLSAGGLHATLNHNHSIVERGRLGPQCHSVLRQAPIPAVPVRPTVHGPSWGDGRSDSESVKA